MGVTFHTKPNYDIFGLLEKTVLWRLLVMGLWIAILLPVFVIIVTALFQYLWNETIPELFNLSALTFGQAFRLLLISAMLFGVGSFIRINIGL